eukprot:441504-Lingulodinium_polyedra.AAC.1
MAEHEADLVAHGNIGLASSVCTADWRSTARGASSPPPLPPSGPPPPSSPLSHAPPPSSHQPPRIAARA